MVFSEDSRVKIPCILHLARLGYRYLSLKNAVWDEETNIFPELFRAAIARINPDMGSGDLDRLLADVKLSLDNEDLGNAFYEKLTERSGIRLIDSNSEWFGCKLRTTNTKASSDGGLFLCLPVQCCRTGGRRRSRKFSKSRQTRHRTKPRRAHPMMLLGWMTSRATPSATTISRLRRIHCAPTTAMSAPTKAGIKPIAWRPKSARKPSLAICSRCFFRASSIAEEAIYFGLGASPGVRV